jgi:hypothetical protein
MVLKRFFPVLVLLVVMSPALIHAQVNPRIVREVRHELVTLPYYGVFDWLQFEPQGDTVILRGQVVRPSTKSDAESRVKDIEGVAKVVNEIEVLSVSPSDDRLRLALYRAIYGHHRQSRTCDFERRCCQQGRREHCIHSRARRSGFVQCEE